MKSTKSIQAFLLKNKFLFFSLAAVLLARIPFLFEPLISNQESLYLAIAKGLVPNYKATFIDLIPIKFTAVSFWLFGNSLWAERFTLTLLLILQVMLFFFIGKKILGKIIIKYFFLFSCFIISIYYFGTSFLSLYSLLVIPTTFLTFLTLNFYFKNFTKFQFLFFLVITVFLIIFVTKLIIKRTDYFYYPNFLTYVKSAFAGNKLAGENYFSSFGEETKRNYTLAFFIESKVKPEQSFYCICRSISIYPLSSRKSSTNFIFYSSAEKDGLVTDLTENKPEYLIVENDESKFSLMDTLIKRRYNPFAQTEDVTLFQLKHN